MARGTHRRVQRPATAPGAATPTVPAGTPPAQPWGGSSTDDTDGGWGEVNQDQARDAWLKGERPPHWDQAR